MQLETPKQNNLRSLQLFAVRAELSCCLTLLGENFILSLIERTILRNADQS
jgi:hypothetical protein